MSASNCTSYLRDLCSLGGQCVIDSATLQEKCVCYPGFSSDNTFFHNAIPNCSLPRGAYMGWLLFQSLVDIVVLYRLFKQVEGSKGMIRRINIEWIVAVVSSWVIVLGFALQQGAYEMVFAAIIPCTVGVVFSSCNILALFIEARHAADLRSPAEALRWTDRAKYSISSVFTLLGCLGIALCRDDTKINIVCFCFEAMILFSQISICLAILHNVLRFEKVVKAMIKTSDQVKSDVIDEKPALLRRLKIFKHLPLIAFPFIAVPGVGVIVVYASLQTIPLMWVIMLFVVQFFPIVGLYMDRLNSLIQNFKLKKTMEKVANGQLSLSESAEHVGMKSTRFGKQRNIVCKVHHIQKDRSLLSDLFGFGFQHWITKIVFSKPWILFIWTTAAPIMSMAAAGLFKRDAFPVEAFAIANIFTSSMVVLTACSDIAPDTIRRSFYQSSMFQIRTVLIWAALFSVCAVVQFAPGPSLYVSFLDLVGVLFFTYDGIRKDRQQYDMLIFLLASTVPIFVWFVLVFDLLDGRYNQVYSLGGNHPYSWSSYHFAMDLHLFIVWCVFCDILRLIKNTSQTYLYLFAPMATRLVKIENDSEDDGKVEGPELDLSLSKRRQSERPRTMHKMVQPNESTSQNSRPLVKSLVIREKDSLLARLVGLRNASRMLRYQEHNPLLVSGLSGLTIGLCLALWSGLVLTEIVPAVVSIPLLIILAVPLAYRLSLKSVGTAWFLCERIEFFTEFPLILGFCIFSGISLGGALSSSDALRVVPGIIGMGLVLLDYRLSDANVNPVESSPYRPSYLFPVLIGGVLLLPSLVLTGYIPRVQYSTRFVFLPSPEPIPDDVDVFLLSNPPSGALSRLRFAQLTFDAMYIFAIKLLLDYVQYAIMNHRARTIPGRLPTYFHMYLQQTVVPELCENAPPPSSADPFWDLDHASATAMEMHTTMSIDPNNKASAVTPVGDNNKTASNNSKKEMSMVVPVDVGVEEQ